MAVTINQIDDAILAALAADATIDSWGTEIVSYDQIDKIGNLIKGNYPAIAVAYAKEDNEIASGGTGSGFEDRRIATWVIIVTDKNLRGKKFGRSGDPQNPIDNPGTNAMVDKVRLVIGGKRLGLAIKRFEPDGNAFIIASWDPSASSYVMRFKTEFLQTLLAD